MDEQGRKEFGEYLRRLRTARQMSQKEAAKKAGISTPYLAQVERGQRNAPSRNILARLSEIYGITSKELWQKAEYADGRSKQKHDLAELAHEMMETIEEKFRIVCADSKFTFGNRAIGKGLDFETKVFIIELYEKNTGKRLLTDQEATLLHKGNNREDGEDFRDTNP